MSMPSTEERTPTFSPSRAASATSAACRSALVGMHPRCRQVPPTLSRSTKITDRSSSAARSAHAYPPLPAPRMTRSAVREPEVSATDEHLAGVTALVDRHSHTAPCCVREAGWAAAASVLAAVRLVLVLGSRLVRRCGTLGAARLGGVTRLGLGGVRARGLLIARLGVAGVVLLLPAVALRRRRHRLAVLAVLAPGRGMRHGRHVGTVVLHVSGAGGRGRVLGVASLRVASLRVRRPGVAGLRVRRPGVAGLRVR